MTILYPPTCFDIDFALPSYFPFSPTFRLQFETPDKIAQARCRRDPDFLYHLFLWSNGKCIFCRAKSKIAHILTSASTSALPLLP